MTPATATEQRARAEVAIAVARDLVDHAWARHVLGEAERFAVEQARAAGYPGVGAALVALGRVPGGGKARAQIDGAAAGLARQAERTARGMFFVPKIPEGLRLARGSLSPAAGLALFAGLYQRAWRDGMEVLTKGRS